MATTKRPRKPARQILFVLGMHRSGTSALSGVLTHLGAQAPRSLMVPNQDNPKGYWESVELMKLHDRVLASAGSRWNDWSHFNPDWIETPVAESFRDSLVPLLEREFGDARLLLVKDPRISRFFPLWRQALEGSNFTPKILLPLRHPQEVAESLAVRNHFGRHRSLLLWLRHMLEAEASTRDLKRSFVPYDALLDDWQVQARRIAEELDLRWPAWSGDSEAKIDEFLSAELRHHVAPAGVTGSEEFAGWTDAAYRCLVELARGQADAPLFAELDRIRSEFDQTSAIYAAVVREHETRVEGLYAKVKVQLAEANQKIEKLTTTQEEVQAKLSETRMALGERDSSLSAQQARSADLANRLDALRAKGLESVAALEARLATSDAELRTVRADTEAKISKLRQQVAGLESERDEAVAALEARLATSDAELRTVRADSEVEISKLRQQVAGLESERDEAVAALETRLSARNADYALLATQFEAQTAAKDALESRCADAAARSAELSRALESAQAGQQQAEASVADRFQETAKLTEMVFRLEQALAEKEAALAEASGAFQERDRVYRESEQVQARRSALDEFSIATLRNRVASLEHQLNEWRATASDSREALTTLRGSRTGRLLGPLLRIPEPAAEPPTESEFAHAVWLLRQSDLFDADWYRDNYLASADEHSDPVVHYLCEGALAGFNPGPEFDTVSYLLRYPDIRRSAANPLVHYLEHGMVEGRSALSESQGGA